MYRIDELEIQNLQDSWSSMYIILARNIMEMFGRSGEGVIREAIRRYGRDLGMETRKLHLNKAIKINLKNLYSHASNLHYDPRFRENLIRLDEQVYISDVITCPMASIWNKNNCKALGRLYCEEFYQAYYKSYCYSKAQINISKTLTHDGDNHCQMSMYFRPANLEKELRDKCFEGANFDYKSEKKIDINPKEAKEIYKSLWLKMYYFILEVAYERYSYNGLAAIAQGLQKLAVDASDFLIKRADMTGNTLNSSFISKNYPVDIDIAEDSFWDKYSEYDAKEILNINFIHGFKRQLGL